MRQKQKGTLGNPETEFEKTLGGVIYLMHTFAYTQTCTDEHFRVLSEVYAGVFGVDLPVEARRVLRTTAARGSIELALLFRSFYAAARVSGFDARAWWFS